MIKKRTTLSLLLSLTAALGGCTDSADNRETTAQASEFRADIVWTEYGIPHITADDWKGLGYGYGYAYAQLNYCLVMREIVYANGESARYFPAEEAEIEADLAWKWFNSDERIDDLQASAPQFSRDLTRGYAAGLNRFLSETGIDNLADGPDGCRNAEWVREVTDKDIARRLHKAVLTASGEPLIDFMIEARPPVAVDAESGPSVQAVEAADTPDIKRAKLKALLKLPEPGGIGSNAYAIGADAAQGEHGLLLANPHFPWTGPLRFFLSRMAIPGEYDVMGVSIAGIPLNIIGFNKDLAWSHTTSFAARFSFYELTINPDNPFEYQYDGQMRPITSETVTAERLRIDGSIEKVEHTFYFSHFGPILSVPFVAEDWPANGGSLITYRDANIGNFRAIEQYRNMGAATTVDEFVQALGNIGIPWFHTLVADRNGDAFYGDVSTHPHVTTKQRAECRPSPLIETVLTRDGAFALDGSRSDCEWGNDPDTPPGVFGVANLPQLKTRDYVANANDSHWLTNPRHLLEGFPEQIGAERVEQRLRTRATFALAEARLSGTDGMGEPGFNIDNLRDIMFGHHNYLAELTADSFVSACQSITEWFPETEDPLPFQIENEIALGDDRELFEQQQTERAELACNLLAAWDRSFKAESHGAIFFKALVDRSSIQFLPWDIPFDPFDPVNTPRQLNPEVLVQTIRGWILGGINFFEAADGFASFDRTLGEYQYLEHNGERIPIPGGPEHQMFSVITTEPGLSGLNNIREGNTYIQAVTWDSSDCPIAFGAMPYSQSSDPASPHHRDASVLYSLGEWIDLPFCQTDIDDQEVRRQYIEQ